MVPNINFSLVIHVMFNLNRPSHFIAIILSYKSSKIAQIIYLGNG